MESLRKKIKGRCIRKVVIYFMTCCLILNTSLPVVLAEVVYQPEHVDNRGDITVTPDTADPFKTNMTASDGAIGHFSDFDIATGHFVDCVQSSADASALFRIFSENGTQIHGRFDATGHIYLIDTAGILFGAGSEINVTRLVASGLNMSDPAFDAVLEGEQMIFSSGNGDVTNNGTITAADGVYLVGDDVINNGSGSILCSDGLVVLAAGEALRLGQPGSSVSVIVNIDTDLIAYSGNDLTNDGTISAGELVLASGDVFSQAISNVGDLAVIANEDVVFNGDITVTGNVDVLGGQNPGSDADIDVHGNITAADIRLKNGADTGSGSVGEKTYSPIVVDEGKNLTATDGDVVVEAVHDILLGGNVEATGNIYLNADEDGYGDPRDQGYSEYPYGGGDVIADGTINAGGKVDILGNAIRFEADVIATDGDLTITGRTSSEPYGGTTFLNDSRWGEIQVAEGTTLSAGQNVSITDGGGGPEDPAPSPGTVSLTGEESLTIVAGAAEGVDYGQIILQNVSLGVVGATSLTLEQDLDLNLADAQWDLFNQSETDLTLISNNGSVTAVETGGNPENAADQWASVGAAANTGITLSGGTGDMTTKQLASATGDIDVNAKAEAGQLLANESIEATAGSVNLTADGGIDADGDITAGTNINLNSVTEAAGDLLAGADININDDLTLNGGEWVYDEGLETWVWKGNQLIEATNGTITAESWIWKETPGELRLYGGDPELAIDLQYPSDLAEDDASIATAGNLYMRGNGDVQIAGDVTALGGEYWDTEVPDPPGEPGEDPLDIGGVSIVSENGKIYTEDGVDNDTINVAIEGYSDQTEGIGVGLPLDPDKKAAIVLVNNEDLKLGPDSELFAVGIYDADVVDDRAAIGFLDEPDQIIDGQLRNEGDPIDVAIYVGSAEGDVEIRTGSVVNITVEQGEGFYIDDIEAESSLLVMPGGTMVADAYDTVTIAGDGHQVNVYNAQYIDDLEFFIEELAIVLDDIGIEIDIEDLMIQAEEYFVALGYGSPEEVLADPEFPGPLEDFLKEYLSQFAGVDRLEVCSRITGTLNEAVVNGTLPGAGDPDYAPDGVRDGSDGYVLRGEGDLSINRAWVLEAILPIAMPDSARTPIDVPVVGLDILGNDNIGEYPPVTVTLDSPTSEHGGTVTLNPDDGTVTYEPPADLSGLRFNEKGEATDTFTYSITDASEMTSESTTVTITLINTLPVAPLYIPYIPAAPGLQREVIEISGCPALVKWVASELGTDESKIQIWIANSVASDRNIQSCDVCGSLKEAATILRDADGTRVAALAEVINEFASSTAPPTEEQMASIADAIANDIEDNKQYAAAGEYLDALAKYVGILNSEMGFSADESVQFATDNYVGQLAEGENVGVAAYVAARLVALGGSQ